MSVWQAVVLRRGGEVKRDGGAGQTHLNFRTFLMRAARRDPLHARARALPGSRGCGWVGDDIVDFSTSYNNLDASALDGGGGLRFASGVVLCFVIVVSGDRT